MAFEQEEKEFELLKGRLTEIDNLRSESDRRIKNRRWDNIIFFSALALNGVELQLVGRTSLESPDKSYLFWGVAAVNFSVYISSFILAMRNETKALEALDTACNNIVNFKYE